MNYAKLIYLICQTAIKDKFVNFAGSGDIYEINALNIDDYPIFWVSATDAQIEHQNYIDYNLTFYYLDREKYTNNEAGDTDDVLIHSHGITVLSNVIKNVVIELGNNMLNEINTIDYTLWGDTEIFSDKTSGVYCKVNFAIPKETNCPY